MNKALQPPTRERRLDALSAYLGDAAALVAEFEAGPPATRIRAFSQTAADDVSAALRVLAEVEGLGVIVHGARGCAGALARPRSDRPWAVTNLDQRDTILGADGVLARSLRALHDKYRPWAIVVVATPVVAINNDDIQAVAEEISEELGIPVIELRADGFRSRVAATGCDLAAQALATLVQPRRERRRDLVNLLAFERGPGLDAIAQQLELLALEVNIFPAMGGREAYESASQAVLSVGVFSDETDALRCDLDRLHGVPFVRLPPPIGAAATHRFVTAVAEATERPLPAPVAAAPNTELLGGKRVVVALPPSRAFAVAELVGAFGGDLIGVSVDWIDRLHLDALKVISEKWPALPVHVGAGQPFELVNWFDRIAPDLVIGSPAAAATAARSGIAAAAIGGDELLGATGEARLASRIKRALGGHAHRQRLVPSKPAYQAGWLKRSADWHIKREVR